MDGIAAVWAWGSVFGATGHEVVLVAAAGILDFRLFTHRVGFVWCVIGVFDVSLLSCVL